MEAQWQCEEEEKEIVATLLGSFMKTLTMKDLIEFFNHLENALDILDKKILMLSVQAWCISCYT